MNLNEFELYSKEWKEWSIHRGDWSRRDCGSLLLSECPGFGCGGTGKQDGGGGVLASCTAKLGSRFSRPSTHTPWPLNGRIANASPLTKKLF